MALVLCNGVDETLIETRKLILERAGHIVVTALGETATEGACKNYVFDVVVIGQAISRDAKRRVFEVVRKDCPTAKILELCRPYEGRLLPDADDWLSVPAEVPSDLAERVNALARAAEKQN